MTIQEKLKLMHPVPKKSDAELAEETPQDSESAQWQVLGATNVVQRPEPVASPPIQPPQLGAPWGDFQLVEKLGEGAMGAVYKAKQLSFDRVIALKLLFHHIAKNPRLVERLYREGRVLGQLDHPNLLQAYGVGEHGGCHYIAMEFVEGANLQSWLGKVERFSVPDAVAVTISIARGLSHAHGIGVIHRDIKPENILVTADGQVKVGDFGMVKTDDEEMSLTQTGHAVGTPWYMSPEQARSAKDIDARADIYALGCVLYCLLTGHPPFQGRTLVEVIQAKEIGTFPPARSTNRAVPEKLDLILLKMTAKATKHRYANCDELIVDLESMGLAAKTLSFMTRTAAPLTETPLPIVGRTAVEADVWYLRVSTSPGKAVLKKFATEQIRKMVETGDIEPNAKASRDKKEGFRSLSTYKEFTSAFNKVSKAGADQASSHYRELYKKIEAEDEEREAHRPVDREVSNVGYWLQVVWQYGRWPLLAAVIIGFISWVVRGLIG